jgi:hypothetical protein
MWPSQKQVNHYGVQHFLELLRHFFGSEMDFVTFKRKLRNNIVQLEMQIEQGSDCMVGFRELKTQLKGFMTMDFRAFKNSWDYASACSIWKECFTSMEVEVFRDQLLNLMNILEMVLNVRSLHLREMQEKKRDSNEKERSTSGNDSDVDGKHKCKDGLNNAAAVSPSQSLVALVQVHQSNDDDILENVFAYETQSHGQPEYINDTYVVNQNDRNITPETPQVDLNGGTVEHNSVNRDQECASTALMIKNMQNEVDRCNRLNYELKAKNVSLTRDIECYKIQLSNMENKFKYKKSFEMAFQEYYNKEQDLQHKMRELIESNGKLVSKLENDKCELKQQVEQLQKELSKTQTELST